MFYRIGFILALIVLLAFPPAATAYEFSPIVAQFSPNGPGSARTFIVTNTQSQPVALQLEMYQRSADDTGKEIRRPEYDNFVVTPPQLVLPAGQSQSIRVQWIGNPSPEVELAYRLIVSQLPIPYAREDTGQTYVTDVKMGLRYEAALYIVPEEGAPHAEVIASEAATAEDGSQVLRMTLKSSGQRRAILEDPSLMVSAGGREVELSGEDVAPLQNRNLIAGTQAIIDVPWPESLPVGPVNVSMETRYLQF